MSCALELAVRPSVENPSPALHMMIQAGDDCLLPGVNFEAVMDFVGVAFHGMATSHIDALCHVFVDGQMYNGFSKHEVKSTGARRGSIMAPAAMRAARSTAPGARSRWGSRGSTPSALPGSASAAWPSSAATVSPTPCP